MKKLRLFIRIKLRFTSHSLCRLSSSQAWHLRTLLVQQASLHRFVSHLKCQLLCRYCSKNLNLFCFSIQPLCVSFLSSCHYNYIIDLPLVALEMGLRFCFGHLRSYLPSSLLSCQVRSDLLRSEASQWKTVCFGALILVAMPFAPSSFLFLVVPGATSSFLLLVAMHLVAGMFGKMKARLSAVRLRQFLG